MGGSSHRTDSGRPRRGVSAAETAAARTSLRDQSTEESIVTIALEGRFLLRTGEARE